MSGGRIVALAGDPGGGAALFPVLQALQSEGASLEVLAYGETFAKWSACGLSCTALPDTATVDPAPFLEGASLLITGTSCNALNAERSFWLAASRKGVPSLAVLDFWSNYRERFLIGSEPFWPTRIAVMDEISAHAMVQAGCPRGNIEVTGHPGLEALAGSQQALDRKIVGALRRAHGADESHPLVLFVSQPLSTFNRDFIGRASAFDEFSVLTAVLESLEKWSAESHSAPSLLVRPHPREIAGKFECLTGRFPGLAVDSATPAHALVQAADLVVGMNSMLLLEACLLGRPVLSIQPGGDPAHDPLPTNGFGASLPVYDERGIFPALAVLLSSSERRALQAGRTREFRPRPGAVQRVLTLAKTLAR